MRKTREQGGSILVREQVFDKPQQIANSTKIGGENQPKSENDLLARIEKFKQRHAQMAGSTKDKFTKHIVDNLLPHTVTYPVIRNPDTGKPIDSAAYVLNLFKPPPASPMIIRSAAGDQTIDVTSTPSTPSSLTKDKPIEPPTKQETFTAELKADAKKLKKETSPTHEQKEGLTSDEQNVAVWFKPKPVISYMEGLEGSNLIKLANDLGVPKPQSAKLTAEKLRALISDYLIVDVQKAITEYGQKSQSHLTKHGKYPKLTGKMLKHNTLFTYIKNKETQKLTKRKAKTSK
jgi:hypothetical protein